MRMNLCDRKFRAIFVLAWTFSSSHLFAAEDPPSYIEKIKKQLAAEQEKEKLPDPSSENYSGKLRQNIETEDAKKASAAKDTNLPPSPSAEGYAEKIKATLGPGAGTPSQAQDNYVDAEKQKLGIVPEGGAIQALNEGRSELHAKKVGKIRHAFGIKYGDNRFLTRDISATSDIQLRKFTDVYGAGYSPDVSIFYEFQPFHSKYFGNIGFVGQFGVAYFQGKGQFSSALLIPGGGGTAFPALSSTSFQFFAVPVTLGIDYRFNLFHYLRPFALVGLNGVVVAEMRNDNINGSHGYTVGLTGTVGVSILLDWVSATSTWDYYSGFDIKHYYLTIDYSHTRSFLGLINYEVSGFSAGLTFEY